MNTDEEAEISNFKSGISDFKSCLSICVHLCSSVALSNELSLVPFLAWWSNPVPFRAYGRKMRTPVVPVRVASLARAVGPTIAAFLIYSAVAFVGFDHQPHNMSDASILRTFWTAAAIQFVAFLLAIYFARVYGKKYLAAEMAEAT